jgi:hypothetical protein
MMKCLCGGSIVMRTVVSAVAAVLLATSAQAAHRKIHRHPAQPFAQAVQPKPKWAPAVKPKPAGDPLYESCEAPWKHPEFQCPNDAGGP